MVFGISSSSNFTAPPTHSSPFHSKTEKEDRNYFLDLILFVWEAVIVRGDFSENSPVLLNMPTPSWAMGFTGCLHSPHLKIHLRCVKRRKKPHKMWRWGNLSHTDPTCMTGSDVRHWSSRHILGFSILKSTCLKTIDSFFFSVQLQGTEEAAVMSWAPTPNATFFCQQILCGWWL